MALNLFTVFGTPVFLTAAEGTRAEVFCLTDSSVQWWPCVVPLIELALIELPCGWQVLRLLSVSLSVSHESCSGKLGLGNAPLGRFLFLHLYLLIQGFRQLVQSPRRLPVFPRQRPSQIR